MGCINCGETVMVKARKREKVRTVAGKRERE
jgi:DNA-directed RNA polymerase subunit RPC12/RpoP